MGQIKILVSSTDLEEGEFDIVAVQILKDPVCAAQETCNQALVLNPMDCVELTTSSCNTNTCPETSNFGTGCTFTSEETVWFTFTTPVNAESVEIDIDNVTSGETPMWGLMVGGCGSLVNVGGCSQASYTVLPNTQYWIAVGTIGGDGSDFDLHLTIITPPVNDECAGVVTLSMTGATINGTTFCADPEFSTSSCSASNFENAVWYQFTTVANQSKVELTVTSTVLLTLLF